jgi:hypothetical protein
MTAADARSHLVQLEAERALTHVDGLGEVQDFVADLEDEIDEWRRRYIATALSEFATLRAGIAPAERAAGR